MYRAIKHLPMRNMIVFESNPEFSDNTYAVYQYLVDEKHIDEKYRIVWLVADRRHVKPPRPMKNTQFVNYKQHNKSLRDRLLYHYVIHTAKAIVFCNRIPGKNRKRQFSVCLQHGMPLKASNGGYVIKDNCDKCLCVSEFFADNYHKDFEISYHKMFFCPFPRTDALFTSRDVRAELGMDGYAKVFVWLPTYRKSALDAMAGFNIETTATGIPSMNTVADMERVDAWLRAHNCLMLFKPHPAQPVDPAVAAALTNFKVIDNAWLSEKNMQLYELLGKTDGLITDYSSVYYDYLLTDKPIGLTVDDIDDYIKNRGFVYDDPFTVLKGQKILNNGELIAFLADTLAENDPYAAARTAVKEKIYTDPALLGGAAAFVGDMIAAHL